MVASLSWIAKSKHSTCAQPSVTCGRQPQQNREEENNRSGLRPQLANQQVDSWWQQAKGWHIVQSESSKGAGTKPGGLPCSLPSIFAARQQKRREDEARTRHLSEGSFQVCLTLRGYSQPSPSVAQFYCVLLLLTSCRDGVALSPLTAHLIRRLSVKTTCFVNAVVS